MKEVNLMWSCSTLTENPDLLESMEKIVEGLEEI